MSATDENGGDKTMVMPPPARAGTKDPAPRALLKCRNAAALGSPAGVEVLLDGSVMTMGRGSDNLVALKADGVSRNHCKLFPGDGAWGIEDVGSTNGVLVNGTKVRQTWLKQGDVITLGTLVYDYEVMVPPAAEEEHDVMQEAEKTVVMRPTIKKQVTDEAATRQTPTAGPVPAGATPRTQPAATRPVARPVGASRPSARPAASGTGSGLKLIIALVAVVVAVVVAALVLK